VHDKAIGQILSDLRQLKPEQVAQVLRHQRKQGLRFGEAAVALGLVEADDVLYALSQQFHYPYAPKDRRGDSPDLVALNEPFSYRAETFRALRSQLMCVCGARPAAPSRAGRHQRRHRRRQDLLRGQPGGGAWRNWAGTRCWSTPTCATRARTRCSRPTTAAGCPASCRGVPSSR
jgi:hypothetical protein